MKETVAWWHHVEPPVTSLPEPHVAQRALPLVWTVDELDLLALFVRILDDA